MFHVLHRNLLFFRCVGTVQADPDVLLEPPLDSTAQRRKLHEGIPKEGVLPILIYPGRKILWLPRPKLYDIELPEGEVASPQLDDDVERLFVSLELLQDVFPPLLKVL